MLTRLRSDESVAEPLAIPLGIEAIRVPATSGVFEWYALLDRRRIRPSLDGEPSGRTTAGIRFSEAG